MPLAIFRQVCTFRNYSYGNLNVISRYPEVLLSFMSLEINIVSSGVKDSVKIITAKCRSRPEAASGGIHPWAGSDWPLPGGVVPRREADDPETLPRPGQAANLDTRRGKRA